MNMSSLPGWKAPEAGLLDSWRSVITWREERLPRVRRFINIEIARASNVMAELSRNDNQAMLKLSELSRQDAQLMIEIARDSRSVALATARDSASMRVIAIVTILFLPATFTAYDNGKFHFGQWYCGCNEEAKWHTSTKENSKGERYEPKARSEKSFIEARSAPRTTVSRRTTEAMPTPNTARQR
ncbi:hypothetical protein MY5147_009337 [Beauveria neobassiana]